MAAHALGLVVLGALLVAAGALARVAAGVVAMNYYNPPKCRACGFTICPNVWACLNPRCPKNAPKPKKSKPRRRGPR